MGAAKINERRLTWQTIGIFSKTYAGFSRSDREHRRQRQGGDHAGREARLPGVRRQVEIGGRLVANQ